MPQTLTIQQIDHYQSAVAMGGIEAMREVYASLHARGYHYAGWAAGVAATDGVMGLSAAEYLSGTALMGPGGVACRNLAPRQLDKIRMDLAIGYLDTLLEIARGSGNAVGRDVRYQEAQAFHEAALCHNGLTLENWTLSTPMDLLRQEKGTNAVEEMWRRLRDTGGNGSDSLRASMAVLDTVGRSSRSRNPAIRRQAQDWLANVLGLANWAQIETFAQITARGCKGFLLRSAGTEWI